MSELTYQGFCDFVCSRHPSETINHHTFRSCALGHYVETIFGEFEYFKEYLTLSDQFEQFIEQFPEYLKRILTDSSCKVVQQKFPTYRELQDWINAQK